MGLVLEEDVPIESTEGLTSLLPQRVAFTTPRKIRLSLTNTL